jgi:hypothetical protein
MQNVIRFSLLLSMLGLFAACGRSQGFKIASRDYAQFKADVHPHLLRDCGFHACHGSTDRFFRVWGVGRVRLDPMLRELSPPTTNAELDYSVQMAYSMIDFDNPSQSLLLRKPLAVEAGGAGHEGADKYGRNVYRSVNDEGYLALARWVVAAARNVNNGGH